MGDQKPLLQSFGKKQAISLFREAACSPRKRKNYNLHELSDTVQRFANAMMPFSYVRPHRHKSPPKTETFILLFGKVWVVLFDDEGKVKEAVLMDGKKIWVVDLLPGCWHTLIPLVKSLTFEIKPGPYDMATDKEFASWAPTDEDMAQQQVFLCRWLEEIKKLST